MLISRITHTHHHGMLLLFVMKKEQNKRIGRSRNRSGLHILTWDTHIWEVDKKKSTSTIIPHCKWTHLSIRHDRMMSATLLLLETIVAVPCLSEKKNTRTKQCIGCTTKTIYFILYQMQIIESPSMSLLAL